MDVNWTLMLPSLGLANAGMVPVILSTSAYVDPSGTSILPATADLEQMRDTLNAGLMDTPQIKEAIERVAALIRKDLAGILWDTMGAATLGKAQEVLRTNLIKNLVEWFPNYGISRTFSVHVEQDPVDPTVIRWGFTRDGVAVTAQQVYAWAQTYRGDVGIPGRL